MITKEEQMNSYADLLQLNTWPFVFTVIIYMYIRNKHSLKLAIHNFFSAYSFHPPNYSSIFKFYILPCLNPWLYLSGYLHDTMQSHIEVPELAYSAEQVCPLAHKQSQYSS